MMQFNVSNPSAPTAIGGPDNGVIVGRADYVTGEDSSPEAGGNALVAVAVAPYPIAPDSPAQTSHVMLYRGTSSAGGSGTPDGMSWIGAVSLTEDILDGAVSSIALRGNRIFAATTRKGIQVVDVDQVLSEFQGSSSPVINHGINTAGQGFAMDAVIGTIGIQNDPTFEYLDTLSDIKVADYSAAGGQNQTLAVVTGFVPLGAPTAPGVSFIVADPNSQAIVSKTTPQSGAGSLQRGVALALGPVQTSTAAKNIAAVAGYGTAVSCGGCAVLAVIDMTDPTKPQPLGFAALSDVPTDVVLNGNTAIVGYSSNTSELFDLTNPLSPLSLGMIQGVGGRLFLYNSMLFSTGAVPGVPASPLGGVHIAQLIRSPFTMTAIDFTGNCTVLTPPSDSQAGAGCFNVYNDTVDGDTVIGDTVGTAPLSKNPAWQPGAGLPVAYVKGQTINLKVTVTQNPVPTIPSDVTITGQAGAGIGNCTWTGQVPLTPTFTFTCTMTTAKAMVYNAISWSYISGGATGIIGITSNPIYVTLAPPLQYTDASYLNPSPSQGRPSDLNVYHTTLNLALSSSESTDQTSAFWNTWHQFSVPIPSSTDPTASGPANIHTWQGRKLYYYRNDPGGVPGTTIVGFRGCALNEGTLLLNEGFDGNGNLGAGHNSGQCGSFARLLIGAFSVNGIRSAWADIEPSASIGALPAFLVQDWSTPQSDSSGPWQLCLNPVAPPDIMVPAQPDGLYCDLNSKNTLPGQNTQPPSEKIFNSHFIVKPLGVSGAPTYVDPSYGATYSSAANFVQKAVFGYFDLATRYRTTSGIIYYVVTTPASGDPQVSITP